MQTQGKHKEKTVEPIDARTLAALPAPMLDWYDRNKRDLPWRQTADPYRIWLSEIMLQQTRVEAARDYYLRFVEAYPDAETLAATDEQRLLKLWEGLGYYSRARNCLAAARVVVERYNGKFPADRAALSGLPGIGDYTAGAIASIAFGLPEAAVDGNVLRIASRVLACDTPTGDAAYKKRLTEALSAVYPQGRCGDFTQSFMDLGSAVCLPASPRCGLCPLAFLCKARAFGTIGRYPVKTPKRPRKQVQLTVLALRNEGALAVERRPDEGLLAGLWQLPNLPGKLEDAAVSAYLRAAGVRQRGAFTVSEARHVFTHVEWDMTVYTMEADARSPRFVWADEAALRYDVALPTAFRRCLLGGGRI